MDDNEALRALPVAVTASRFAKSILLAFCDGCHSFFLAVSASGGARKRPQTEPHLDIELYSQQTRGGKNGGFAKQMPHV